MSEKGKEIDKNDADFNAYVQYVTHRKDEHDVVFGNPRFNDTVTILEGDERGIWAGQNGKLWFASAEDCTLCISTDDFTVTIDPSILSAWIDEIFKALKTRLDEK
jgi:hypothetical protein